MNRSTMRSNISFQSEGRLIPRRKVATKSHLLNGVGDYDMELSLAIQESLKYAQQMEHRSPLENDSNSEERLQNCDNEEEANLVRGRSDSARPQHVSSKATAKASCDRTAEGDELSRLKDLLLSQLELIQCQQEELHKKDREIKSLQSAKDTLQCRLERMERRLSIMRQREESHEHLERASSPPPLKSLKSSVSEVSRLELKRRRKCSHFSIRKKHKASFIEKSSVCVSRSNGLRDEELESDNDSTPEDSDSGDEEDEVRSDNQSVSSSGTRFAAGKQDSSPVLDEKLIDYPIMQTDIMYHLYYPKHACPSSPDAKKVQEQLEVETPSWRLKPLTNMYQLEGTENITDEAYNKRHLKFEQEEKRRKRWDMQRIRDLQMQEKLEKQKEEEMRASQDEADMETFLPSIHDLRHLEITESVPVMAFGQPLPYVCPAEFEITWDMNSSVPGTSTSKQKIAAGPSRRH